jgi:hypothetical protein
MVMEIPTFMPMVLKIMMSVVAFITVILMALLVIKIYRDDSHSDNQQPR